MIKLQSSYIYIKNSEEYGKTTVTGRLPYLFIFSAQIRIFNIPKNYKEIEQLEPGHHCRWEQLHNPVWPWKS